KTLQRRHGERPAAAPAVRGARARHALGEPQALLGSARGAAEPVLPRLPGLPGPYAAEQPGAPLRSPKPAVPLDAYPLSRSAMRILVTGGTGLIGAPLCRALRGAGHAVTVVSRDPAAAGAGAVDWAAVPGAVPQADALVNLAGEPIAARRWRPA